ncbi:hypothetical protein MATL_G00251730 [Megalops atlanticus]|uniref:GTPase IMAP family member 8-like n=1 Tax=Megalops atlanticus TaxID=7932 RepID=A0A9D3P9H1_MEGAT|nr:hypothetical protein MATL_G00251730 [Megalops atlanticus]
MSERDREEEMASSSGETHRLSELRMVLLGSPDGKSSAGNTILGREAFDTNNRTAQCVERHGNVGGRRVTVVDTPGWLGYHPVEKIKQAIVGSVSLCPPGPHALLLVINMITRFTDTDRRAVEEHLELLGERVWRHTIVLFTWVDRLGHTTIEEHIQRQGKDLQWVIETCGNRYHVFNNKNRDNSTQVTELLEKIEEMVAGNSGCHYEIDQQVLQVVEKKRKDFERKMKQRMIRVQKQRQTLRTLQGGETHRLSELRMVLLGRTSPCMSTRKIIVGREEFFLRGDDRYCQKTEGIVCGRLVTVVDTPGWYESVSTPELVKQEIVHSMSLCFPGPHALLLVIDVDICFTDTDRRAVEEHLELLGERVWRHTIVLFTWVDRLGHTTIEEHIQRQGKDLQWVIETCGNRYHVFNNKNRDNSTQVTELLEKIEEMVAGNSGCHYEIDQHVLQVMEEMMRDFEEQKQIIKLGQILRAQSDEFNGLTQLQVMEATGSRHVFHEGLSSVFGSAEREEWENRQKKIEAGARAPLKEGEGPPASPQRTEGASVTSSVSRVTSLTELLEKMEMVAGNSGCHLGTDSKVSQEVEERKGEDETMVKQENRPQRMTAGGSGGSHVLQSAVSGSCPTQSGFERIRCRSCETVKDSTHWTVVEPSPFWEKGNCSYRLSSPAGRYECAESGVRWVCAVEVTLQYSYCSWECFKGHLHSLNYTKCGPLLDITQPTFSPMGPVEILLPLGLGLSLGLHWFQRRRKPLKVHCDVLVFQSLRKEHLTLDVYLIPRDPARKQRVQELELSQGCEMIHKPPQPNRCLQMDQRYELRADPGATVGPPWVRLEDTDTPPNFSEVFVRGAGTDLCVELLSEGERVWTTEIRRGDYRGAQNAEAPGRSDVRTQFVEGVSEPVIAQLLDDLLAEGVLNDGEVDTVRAERVRADRARYLIDTVRRKGRAARLIALLQQRDPALFSELGRVQLARLL